MIMSLQAGPFGFERSRCKRDNKRFVTSSFRAQIFQCLPLFTGKMFPLQIILVTYSGINFGTAYLSLVTDGKHFAVHGSVWQKQRFHHVLR